MDEAWELITQWKMTKEQFVEWLDQRAWDNASREEVKQEEQVEEGGAVDIAEVAKEWARFERRQARGTSFMDMLPLDQDSDVGEAATKAIETPMSIDPAPTEDFVLHRAVRSVHIPRRLVEEWRKEVSEKGLSSVEEGEIADDEGSWTKVGYSHGRRVRFEEDGGYLYPNPVLTGDSHEDDARIKLATNLFKGLPVE